MTCELARKVPNKILILVLSSTQPAKKVVADGDDRIRWLACLDGLLFWLICIDLGMRHCIDEEFTSRSGFGSTRLNLNDL